MMDNRTICEMPRLAHNGRSVRKMARPLGSARQSVPKYLENPTLTRARVTRARKLDPVKDEIARLLEMAPQVAAAVLHPRLQAQGFDGGTTIVREYFQEVRAATKTPPPVLRCESAPGVQGQTDWGPCGSRADGDTQRQRSCLAVIACYSRLLSLECTHSQRQETLPRGLLQAFHLFPGTPPALVHDNRRTAVLERQGPLGRFNEHFLECLRPFQLTPVACNVAQPQAKGTVAKGAIHYIRHTFWPLRTFRDLTALQAHAHPWRAQVANGSVHPTTGHRPNERFAPHAMRAFPALVPDCRDTPLGKGHTDFSIRFDGHTYTVPPWLMGKAITVKADHHQVTCSCKAKAVAPHWRCWQRNQRIALPQHREAAQKHPRRPWSSQEVAPFIALGAIAKRSLAPLATTTAPLKKSVKKLLALKDDSGATALLDAMQRATLPQAYGAH
jgi:transposase